MVGVGVASLCFWFWLYYMGVEFPFWMLLLMALIGCAGSVFAAWIGVKLAEVIFTSPSETDEESISERTPKK